MGNKQGEADIVRPRSRSLPGSSSSEEEYSKKAGHRKFQMHQIPQRAGGLHIAQLLPRSTQLVFDFCSGRAIPRLREPHHICGVAGHASQVLTRWPRECEVITEEIRHIEWVPPIPEPLCAQTSPGERPQEAEANQAILVFNAEAGREPFFSGSRVGGRGTAPRAAAVSLSGPDDTTLLFESRFESGNLLQALRVGEFDYELALRTDLYTEKHTQWFYFRVRNMRPSVSYRFTITNLLKASSLYTQGQMPLLYSERRAQAAQVGWHRAGQDVAYYRNGRQHLGQPCFSLSWTMCFPYEWDTCYLAHCYPYTYADLRAYLSRIERDPRSSPFCRVRALCRSLAGNPVPVLTVSSGPGSAVQKPAVVLTARVHPGETSSSWVMKGVLDFLLGGSPDAALLRNSFIFKLVPMLNPDGVIVGNHRCSLSGRDLNRSYRSGLQELTPTVEAMRAMIHRLLEERTVLLYCDFHGHSHKQNAFVYGCEDPRSARRPPHERVFPLMLSKNCPELSCRFQVCRSKKGTGRVALWRMGILSSFTLETSICGSDFGRRKGTHFNTQDLEMLGACFCDTLLDFCDPDRTKYSLCLRELQAMISLGGSLLPGLADTCDHGPSDSNSSESDGPVDPVINKEMAWRAKTLRSKKERNKDSLAGLREKVHPAKVKFQEEFTKESMEKSRYELKPVRVPPTILRRDMSKVGRLQPHSTGPGLWHQQISVQHLVFDAERGAVALKPERLHHLVADRVLARTQLARGTGVGAFRWDALSRPRPSRHCPAPLTQLPQLLPGRTFSTANTQPGRHDVNTGDKSTNMLSPLEA